MFRVLHAIVVSIYKIVMFYGSFIPQSNSYYKNSLKCYDIILIYILITRSITFILERIKRKVEGKNGTSVIGVFLVSG